MAIEDDFRAWINEKIQEWLSTGRSESQLALKLGVNQATLNAWKNGTRKMPAQEKIIDKLIDYYGETDDRVFAFFNRTKKAPTLTKVLRLLSGLSLEDYEKITTAARSAEKEIEKLGLPYDSPEAQAIMNAVFSAIGLLDDR